jgi:hypothetical protein
VHVAPLGARSAGLDCSAQSTRDGSVELCLLGRERSRGRIRPRDVARVTAVLAACVDEQQVASPSTPDHSSSSRVTGATKSVQPSVGSWDLDDAFVLIGAGEPIPVPGRYDRTYPFRAHSEYLYLTDREGPGGLLAFAIEHCITPAG